MQIEKSEDGLTVKLGGQGSLALFLQTLLRAKFYDDGGVEGLLSPVLNAAIAATLEKLGADQGDIVNYYSGWVEQWHLARVNGLISSSPNYLSASAAEQKAMMRAALYPHEPKG